VTYRLLLFSFRTIVSNWIFVGYKALQGKFKFFNKGITILIDSEVLTLIGILKLENDYQYSQNLMKNSLNQSTSLVNIPFSSIFSTLYIYP